MPRNAGSRTTTGCLTPRKADQCTRRTFVTHPTPVHSAGFLGVPSVPTVHRLAFLGVSPAQPVHYAGFLGGRPIQPVHRPTFLGASRTQPVHYAGFLGISQRTASTTGASSSISWRGAGSDSTHLDIPWNVSEWSGTRPGVSRPGRAQHDVTFGGPSRRFGACPWRQGRGRP